MVDTARQRRGYRFTSAWRGPLRQRVLKRWGYRCAGCGWPGTDGKGKGLQKAHIVDRADGGPDDESNIIPLCPPCHGRYDAEKRAAKRRRAAS